MTYHNDSKKVSYFPSGNGDGENPLYSEIRYRETINI